MTAKQKNTDKTLPNRDGPDFESAMADLDMLVSKMEEGDLPLEVSLKEFEKGIALSRHCQQALNDAEQRVKILLDDQEEDFQTDSLLHEAMRYSALDGGKRIRPLLVYAAGEALNISPDLLDVPAAALELIHVYSLIHDDLPSMDDDNLRRGKATAHIAYDEATAILSGDALQTRAFDVLSQPLQGICAKNQLKIINILSDAAGMHGMVKGQAIDLAAVGKQLTEEQLEIMHHNKTGALIRASVLMASYCEDSFGSIDSENRVNSNQREKLLHYAEAIGLAFQVHDDILDIESDTETLGKQQGADMAAGKPTYPSIIGMQEAKSKAKNLYEDALKSLSIFGEEANMLREIAGFIPEQLRELDIEQLPAVCDEVRNYLLASVSKSGGHLSAGLGTVELTVALHYVFNTPDDKIVWDVGHQAYAHKVLTGRRDAMSSIKKKDGLCGFPRREESEFDTFGVGHSSTSISAALGMALAAKYKGLDSKSIAVIGDGAMTAGMAYEALNHAGDIDESMLVILNDNDMSISPNVGGLSKYLARLLSGRFYSSMREGSKKILSNTPVMKRFARRAEEHTKGMIMPAATLFEEMGFVYYGPVDGHDVIELVKMFENLKDINEPKFLHVVTQKGKGYEPAENDPCLYHGVSPFDLENGIQKPKTPKSKIKKSQTYTEVFGDWLCDMAAHDDRLVGITPAMREGSGLVEFSERFPDKYYDVAIA
ncbi:1-deoxy-D-xylulose-5-phosphate synthase [Nymphon striatum]|nr:1-deoxy-D-xylulose-5-phosphate synthase [Nymphon striatum]